MDLLKFAREDVKKERELIIDTKLIIDPKSCQKISCWDSNIWHILLLIATLKQKKTIKDE